FGIALPHPQHVVGWIPELIPEARFAVVVSDPKAIAEPGAVRPELDELVHEADKHFDRIEECSNLPEMGVAVSILSERVVARDKCRRERPRTERVDGLR